MYFTVNTQLLFEKDCIYATYACSNVYSRQGELHLRKATFIRDIIETLKYCSLLKNLHKWKVIFRECFKTYFSSRKQRDDACKSLVDIYKNSYQTTVSPRCEVIFGRVYYMILDSKVFTMYCQLPLASHSPKRRILRQS